MTIAGSAALAALLGIGGIGLSGAADSALAAESGIPISPGLVLPPMDPVNGKKLFASKGCVVCHAVNGVGGTDAPEIDAATMAPKISPFDFVAKMWNHSQGMVAMQQDELGGQITFENGKQIADIIAFLHDAKVQKTFSEDDIPANIKAHPESDEDSEQQQLARFDDERGLDDEWRFHDERQKEDDDAGGLGPRWTALPGVKVSRPANRLAACKSATLPLGMRP